MIRTKTLPVAAPFAAVASLAISCRARLTVLTIIATSILLPLPGIAAFYSDNTDDVNPNLGNTYGGTLDIVSAEVSRNSSTGWFTFKLTVNGNISTNSAGYFVFGINDQSGATSSGYNYYGIPFDMSVSSGTGFSHVLIVGVDSGGGWASLEKADPSTSSFAYLDGDKFNNSGGRMTIALSSGAQSTITIGVPPDYFYSFYFDAYSIDVDLFGADALSNGDPITDWNPYVSSYPYYQFFQPPPSSYSLTLSYFGAADGSYAAAYDASLTNTINAYYGQTNTQYYQPNSSVEIGVSRSLGADVARYVVLDSVSWQRTTNYAYLTPYGGGYIGGPVTLLSMDRNYWVEVSVGGYSYDVWSSSYPSDKRAWTNRTGKLNLPNGLYYAMGLFPDSARPSDLPVLVGPPAPGTNTVKFRYREGRSPAGFPIYGSPQIYAATNVSGPWTNASVLSKVDLASYNGPTGGMPVEATVGVPAGASNFFLRLQSVGF